MNDNFNHENNNNNKNNNNLFSSRKKVIFCFFLSFLSRLNAVPRKKFRSLEGAAEKDRTRQRCNRNLGWKLKFGCHLYIKRKSVCRFSIGGYTVEPTELKFGTEDHIYPREVVRLGARSQMIEGPKNRVPEFVCTAQTVCKWEIDKKCWIAPLDENLRR